MTDSEKLETLAGRVHALVGFATAVITSHPNPAILALHLERVSEMNLARAETSAVSENYVEGVQDMRDRLFEVVRIALGRPRVPTDRS